MPTFLDESGDVGPSEKSALFFRIAAVWFETDDDVQRYENAMRILRRETLKLPESFEFHFSKNSRKQREAFFEAISPHNFLFFMASFEKAKAERASLTKELIRESTIKCLVDTLRETYLLAEASKAGTAGLNEHVVFDECDDPAYEQELKRQFKSLASGRGPHKKLVRSVKPSRSRSDVRIQLVDMVCGAVRLHLGQDSRYYNAIKEKCMGIVRIPKRE